MVQAYSTSLTTLAVLESVSRHSRPVRAIDIRDELGLPRAALFAHLATLSEAGWLDRLPDANFRLSMKPRRVAQMVLEQAGLGVRVRPLLFELTERVMEAVSLSTLDDDVAQIIERIDPDRGVIADSMLESRMEIAHSATGRVLLAFGAEAHVEALRRRNVETPTDEELARTRGRGFALSDPSFAGETVAVAVPVIAPGGGMLSALSAIGPVDRFDAEAAAPTLAATADAIRELA
jgi:IclR family pca regulon transcriptional regulator